MAYPSLVIAGIGSVGSGLLRVGASLLPSFNRVILVDRDDGAIKRRRGLEGYDWMVGDITDPQFLHELLLGLPKPVLFLNLCAGTDTVKLRTHLSGYPVAYLDVGAGAGPPEASSSLAKTMDYTYTGPSGPLPHVLCQGINPGMVELMARRVMRTFCSEEEGFDVTILEVDTFTAPLDRGKVAVAWSPEDFVEEMMVLPALQVRDGEPVESEGAGSLRIYLPLGNEMAPARLVAHEDIWHLSLLQGVTNARFIYSLRPEVMEVLEGNPGHALGRLIVPGENVPVYGRDTVSVMVRGLTSGITRSMVWSVDHNEVWKRYGINGVQYQTGKSLLFAMRLLMKGLPGVGTGVYNSGTLPLTNGDWRSIHGLLEELDIGWVPVDSHGLTPVAL
jgi:saccharopine dehydrogenase-like NADP-dependent oxidoreductase